MSPNAAPPAVGEAAPLGAGFDFRNPDSPLARLYLSRGALAAAALLGGLFVFLSMVPLWHTDVWGHLKLGQWVVAHRALPDREPFCPDADPASPGLYAYWLGQAGLYALFAAGRWLAGGDELRQLAGGVQMLRTMHALLVVLRFAVLLAALGRLRCPLPLACAGAVVLFLLSSGHIAVFRPQVFGELFLAVLLLVLSRPVPSRRALGLVPLLLVLWANCHGSWPSGLILLGLALAGRAVEAGRRAAADPAVRRLALILAGSTAAVLALNPHGPFIVTETLRMGSHPNVRAMDEWQPIAWDGFGLPQALYVGTLLLLAVTQLLSPRRFGPTQWLIILVFAPQPLFHQRMMVWWLLLVPWLVLPQWADGGAGRLARWLGDRSLPDLRRTVLAGLIAAVALLWSTPGQWLVTGQPWPLEKALGPGTPWRLARQVAHPGDPSAAWLPGLPAAGGPVFASETLGDTFLWALPPERPVFVYTHVHLFSPEHWRECAVVKRGEPGWADVLARHRINLVVVESELHPQLRRGLWADPDWKVVLDEAGWTEKRDHRTRWMVAVRRQPL
jgi:hypothetical protein